MKFREYCDEYMDWCKSNIFLVSAFLVFLMLLFRNIGLYPIVFGDELLYSISSRLLPFSEATRPNYLYMLVYGITSYTNDGFLECARIINALFFVSATPFIYMVARQVCSKKLAQIVAITSLLSPTCTYTVYFMPESMFFFFFWLFTWFILLLDSESRLWSWCFCGFLLGLLTLVKPHALFMLPAVLCYILWLHKKNQPWLIKAFFCVVAFTFFVFFAKLLIGYLLAGRNGVTLIGGSYSAQFDSQIGASLEKYKRSIIFLFTILAYHLSVICLIFGFPIVCLVKSSLNGMFETEDRKPISKIYSFTLLVLTNFIVIVSLFTLSDSMPTINSGCLTNSIRIHTRYYSFVFPLLLIVAASVLRFSLKQLKSVNIAISIATALSTWIFIKGLVEGQVNLCTCDCPEVMYLGYLNILTLVGITSFLTVIVRSKIGAKIYIYFFIPIMFLSTTLHVQNMIRSWTSVPQLYDTAGFFVKHQLSDEDLAKLLVVSYEPIGPHRAIFYINSCKPKYKYIEGKDFDISKLDPSKEWLLIFGDYKLPESARKISLHGFTLMHIAKNFNVDFKKSNWPGIITRVEGLSNAESWGTWSTANTISIEFMMPLPKKFKLHLTAKAYGPNVGKEFIATIGNESIKFTLAESPEEKVLEFKNTNMSHDLRIDVPDPTSIEQDHKKLGIGLIKVKISECD